MMTPPSRRKLFAGSLASAAFVLVATGAGATDCENPKTEAIVRAWYELWVKNKQWAPFDEILADDFTFSSANGEDHISKTTFKKECWDNQINHINGMDLELVMTKGDRAFVKYLCHTVAGKSFRNVEVLQIRNGQLTDLYCFFGGRSTFPSAVDSRKT
jgi:hypothetical protein